MKAACDLGFSLGITLLSRRRAAGAASDAELEIYMKRPSIVLGACLSTVLLAACGGSKSLPVSPLSGGAPSALGAESKELGSFRFTGSPQSFTVPTGVTALRIVVKGARGSSFSNTAGVGGVAEATIKVHPGEALGIFVGGRGLPQKRVRGHDICIGGKGGYNGGGDGGSSHIRFYGSGGFGGGGASDVRRGGVDGTLHQRVIVAGGGGGQSGNAAFIYGHRWAGGAGGDLTGGRGDSEYDREGGGHGGTQTHGGDGGKIGNYSGRPGAEGVGGSGEGSERVYYANGGGGGGGGWFGGGGGNGNNPDPNHSKGIEGGGGGGSSYVEPGACNVKMYRNPDPTRYPGEVEIFSASDCPTH